MYHKVGAPVQSKADRFVNVSPQSFRRQMRLLARMGYQAITFAEALEGLATSGPLPRRPVCVTFDDAYTNVAEHATPILAAHGWPATVFVPTAWVGDANRWDEGTGWPILPIMDWPQLAALQAAGWEIAGHTRTHPRLNTMDDAAALTELEGCKADLEDHLGGAARTFCYPYGGVNERTPALVRQAGFMGACTTKSGVARPGSDPFLLPRVTVAYRDDVLGFLYRLLIRPHLP